MKTTGKIMRKMTVALVMLSLLSACGEDDSEKEWGYAKVYMPQAAILNGGLNNNYPVPLSNNPSTENYEIDEETNTLKIVLGVYRSGLQKLESYSVKVYVDNEATQAALSGVSRGVVLPADVYTLPTEASVAGGQRETTFYLTVDLNKVAENYAGYNRSRMVLVVGISDPTRYELNENLSKTTVIINGSAFLPAPAIVKGGTFSDGSEEFWTRKILDGADNVDDSFVTIADGMLKYSYGADPVTATVTMYQPVELTPGSTYKLSADFTSSGGAVDGQFFMCISQKEPEDGQYYDPQNGAFANIDAWAEGGIRDAISGKLLEVATWVGGGMERSGEFTPSSAGQYYLIIVGASWGKLSDITLDNVALEEM